MVTPLWSLWGLYRAFLSVLRSKSHSISKIPWFWYKNLRGYTYIAAKKFPPMGSGFCACCRRFVSARGVCPYSTGLTTDIKSILLVNECVSRCLWVFVCLWQMACFCISHIYRPLTGHSQATHIYTQQHTYIYTHNRCTHRPLIGTLTAAPTGHTQGRCSHLIYMLIRCS